MKVFISWSKSLSQECAELLRNWIKCTLQASKPWMSSQDLDKGTVWFNEINNELNETSIGIVCLTRENKNNPWILFEAGALAKGLEEKRVYTFLIDLKPSDIKQPLAQFNHTSPNKAEMKKLLSSINKQLSEPLEDKVLDQVFDAYWPQFDKDFKAAVKNHPVTETEEQESRSSDDILSEILSITRNLDKRVRKVESTSSGFAPIKKEELSDMMENSLKSRLEREIFSQVNKLYSEDYSKEEIIEMLSSKYSKTDIDKAHVKVMANRLAKKWEDVFKP